MESIGETMRKPNAELMRKIEAWKRKQGEATIRENEAGMVEPLTAEMAENREQRRHPERFIIETVATSEKSGRNADVVEAMNAPYKEERISKNGTRYSVWIDSKLRWLENLTDNKLFMNKMKARADEIGIDWMMKLAELAQTKENPSRWMATITALKNWSRTKSMLSRLMRATQRLIKRIGGWIDSDWLPWLIKAEKRLGEGEFWKKVKQAESKEDSWAYLTHSLKCAIEESY